MPSLQCQWFGGSDSVFPVAGKVGRGEQAGGDQRADSAVHADSVCVCVSCVPAHNASPLRTRQSRWG